MARKAYERKISHANKYNAIFVELLERSVNCEFFPKKYFNTYVSHFQLGVFNLHEFPLMPSLFTSSFHYPSPRPRGFSLKAKSQASTLTIHGTVFLCFQYFFSCSDNGRQFNAWTWKRPHRTDKCSSKKYFSYQFNFWFFFVRIVDQKCLRCPGLKIAARKWLKTISKVKELQFEITELKITKFNSMQYISFFNLK